jgi:hypothetical protein
MITRNHEHVSTEQTRPCPCGCAPPEHAGCELECHVRPRFFCGQLLTDEDLSSIVGWAAAKLRLQRFRDGWGVACGLGVTCDPANPQGIVVSAGYAVSCCGDDIVLCRDAPLNLAESCRDEAPCEDPRTRVVDRSAYEKRAELIDKMQGEDPADALVTATRETLEASGAKGDDHETIAVRWVDVFVRYAQRDADPRGTLHHSDCADPPDCEAARTEETYELHWKLGGGTPGEAEAEAWCAGYEECLDVIRTFIAEFGSSYDRSAVRRWLLAVVERHPSRVFCGLRDQICALSDEDLDTRHIIEILTKLVMECRIAYTGRSCHTCQRSDGVRLARVYLGQVAPGAPCRVLHIDSSLPFRRWLARSELHTRPGFVNVGGLIGGTLDEACVRLADHGVRARVDRLAEIESASALLQAVDCGCGPLVECGSVVSVQVVKFDEDWRTGWRVIGFCRHQGDAADERTREEAAGRTEAAGGERVAGEALRKEEAPVSVPGPVEAESTPSATPGARIAGSRRETEMRRMVLADGVGEGVATRLLDHGITMSAVCDPPEFELDRVVSAVAAALGPHGWRAERIVAALRSVDTAADEG